MTNAVTRRPTLLAAVAALVAVSALLVVTNEATATAGVSWSAVNPPLPANAVAGQGLTYASTSCPADGWCIAVGDYLALTGTTYYEPALIAAESGNTWSAVEAPLPSNAAADPQALLQSVSCPSTGTCVAVGRYLDTSGATQGLVDQLSNGTWTPSEVALPAGAMTTGSSAYAQLASVSCTAAGSCTAVGLYTPGTGAEHALIDTDVAGSWSAAAAPLPGAASGSQFLSLACAASGSCVATGTYEVSGIYLGFVDALAGGVWTASALPVPAGTSPTMASISNNDLSVACADATDCVVAGTTFDGNYEGLIDTLSGGTWTATAVPIPDGTPSTDVQLTSVACSDAADCVATGFYVESGVEQGLIDTLAAGTWTPSTAPTPAGTPASANIEIHNVACPATGTCVAVGQSDIAGSINGLFWNLASGSWAAITTPLPADASAGSDPSFSPLTCPGAGVCLAVGTYIGSAGREGVVETDPSLAATTTSVSALQASSTTATYSATVAGSAGPTGTVAFSAGLVALCSATITNGTASCTGPMPATATATVLGSYSGDGASTPSWGTAQVSLLATAPTAPVTAPPAPTAPVATTQVPASVQDFVYFQETTPINSFFAPRLLVLVTDASGNPVPGVTVTFTAPTTGATVAAWGPMSVATSATGIATSPFLSANGKKGTYLILGTVHGLPNVAMFFMTNK
jgi:hypothetical protein